MFLIKKLIIVVAILLVAVFGVSLVSRSIEFADFNTDNVDHGKGGSSSDDGYTGIGLPSSSVMLLNNQAPIYKGIFKLSDEMKEYRGVFGHDGENVVYNGDCYNNLFFKFNGNEYITMRFGELSTDGFSLCDYSHFKVEFDVFNGSETASVLGCSFSLVGRNTANASESLSLSKMAVKLSDENGLCCVETFNGEKIVGESFHVVYVVEVDKENYNQSRMQVFVNDVLYEDSIYFDGLFSDIDVDRITAVTVNDFNTDGYDASISFKNLIVTGYNEVR